MPFALRHWRGLIETGDTLDRRRYETAVAATLRERLRAGEVWVEGTRQYRRFDSYLVSGPAARRVHRPRHCATATRNPIDDEPAPARVGIV